MARAWLLKHEGSFKRTLLVEAASAEEAQAFIGEYRDEVYIGMTNVPPLSGDAERREITVRVLNISEWEPGDLVSVEVIREARVTDPAERRKWERRAVFLRKSLLDHREELREVEAKLGDEEARDE